MCLLHLLLWGFVLDSGTVVPFLNWELLVRLPASWTASFWHMFAYISTCKWELFTPFAELSHAITFVHFQEKLPEVLHFWAVKTSGSSKHGNQGWAIANEAAQLYLHFAFLCYSPPVFLIQVASVWARSLSCQNKMMRKVWGPAANCTVGMLTVAQWQ